MWLIVAFFETFLSFTQLSLSLREAKRAVIKRQGLGISPGYFQRKIEENR